MALRSSASRRCISCVAAFCFALTLPIGDNVSAQAPQASPFSVDPKSINLAEVDCVDLSPTGDLLVISHAAERVGIVELRDLQTEKKLFDAAVSNGGTKDVRFDPAGQRFAVVGHDGTIDVWSVEKRQSIASRQLADCRSTVATFSADGKYLAIGTERGFLHVLDGKTLRDVVTLRRDKYDGLHYFCLAFSFDGQLLVGGGADGEVRVWRIADWKELDSIKGDAKCQVRAVSFTRDSKQLMVAWDHKGLIAFFDTSTWAKKQAFSVSRFLLHVTLLPTNQQFIVNTADEGISLVDSQRGKVVERPKPEYRRHPFGIEQFSGPRISCDGACIAAWRAGGVLVWRIEDKERKQRSN